MWLHVRAVSAALVCAGLAASAPARGANCSETGVGFTPLVDLGTGTYQGFEGGLYPGGFNARPLFHNNAADTLSRVLLLDPNGVPDAAAGQAVLLSVGMSNTTQEFSRFVQIATVAAGRNPALTIVDGAQGGWSADRVTDPNQNTTFWNTINTRLAAAGVTPLQVEAVWLKEAERGPTEPFPQDAERLGSDLQTIVQGIEDRYPNTRQIYLSSRTYGGYASSTLNPEPYAYQSGYSMKWLIEDQLGGSPALNFDPARGAVEAAWLSWGPYLWADGLTPRSDGLTWACADFEAADGTHPSASGENKVANLLLDFFRTDAIARRWFVDCDPNSTGVFSLPPRVLDVDLTGPPGSLLLRWQGLGPASGPSTIHDVVAGSLADLRATGSFAGASCAAAGVAGSSLADPAADPAPGDGVFYLVRGRNTCGAGTYGEPGALAAPRAALDASSPCP